ncbi:SseB family protein [Streptomyces sp. NPDC005438]|uniref:SseB family protein n=1 Tax=Streptomyces sp. NPDC005438 TaxID=3156880 RepID=UPI0033A4AEB7
MGLVEDIAAWRAGNGDAPTVLGSFRRSEILVPVRDDGVLTTPYGGMLWLQTFTDPGQLSRFRQTQGTPVDDILTVHGARLLDQLLPTLDDPTGIAVNAADPPHSILLPPAHPVVPHQTGTPPDTPRAPHGL